MQEFESIHPESTMTDAEARALIARLGQTREGIGPAQIRVKDIAEALDMDVKTVAESLKSVRGAHEPDVQTNRLADALETMKTPVRRQITNKPVMRIIIASFSFFLVTLTSFLLFAVYVQTHVPPTYSQKNKLEPAHRLEGPISRPRVTPLNKSNP